MLDIRFIRDNPEQVQKAARHKGYDVDVNELLKLDEQRRVLQSQTDELRAKRNENAEKMKRSVSEGNKPDQEIIDEGKRIKIELSEREIYLAQSEEAFNHLLRTIPNMPDSDVPIGASEDDNVEIEVVGSPAEFAFVPKNHMEIAAAKGWIDKERAAKVSGSRFAYVQGDLVKLQLAIMQYVIDTLTNQDVIRSIAEGAGLDVSHKPFTPVLPPYLIRTELYDAMDRLQPSDDRYKIEGEELWLQGSAEHVLGSMHADEVFDASELPVRYLGYATSFRKEAGTYGKDMEGIIRMHQFDKLEMESFTTKEQGMNEHLLFVAIQRFLLEQLSLPYHVLQKCTADIGKPNARGVDMEVWIPSQEKYRETHTADYMTDYQARRLQTRYRNEKETELVHTNDATAFALGRIMVAIIENYQTAEGNVKIPPILQTYMGGRESL